MNNYRKIEVTGSAEMEVVPDIIVLTICLKEYYKNAKAFKDKVTIDILEKQLVNAVAEAGFAKESLVIAGIDGNRDYQWPRKKQANFTQSKLYEFTLADLKKIDNVLHKIDEKGLQYTNIQKTEHSQIAKFKKEIKTKALLAAKEEAQFLLECLGEKLGEPLEINTIEEYNSYPMYAQNNVRMLKSASSDSADLPESDLEYQKIKLSYKMRAVFRMKD